MKNPPFLNSQPAKGWDVHILSSVMKAVFWKVFSENASCSQQRRFISLWTCSKAPLFPKFYGQETYTLVLMPAHTHSCIMSLNPLFFPITKVCSALAPKIIQNLKLNCFTFAKLQLFMHTTASSTWSTLSTLIEHEATEWIKRSIH